MEMVIHQLKIKLLDGADMAADHTSGGIDIDAFSLFAIQFIWTDFAATSADIFIEASIDEENFTVIDTYSLPVSEDSGTYLANIEKAGYSMVRVRYAQVDGEGTITCLINGKIL